MKNPRRQASRRGSAGKTKAGLIGLAILIAVNVGVFLYHGDPRERARSAAPPSQTSATANKTWRPRATQRRADASKRAIPTPWASADNLIDFYSSPVIVDDGEIAPWAVTSIDPLLGVRSQGPLQRIEMVEIKAGQTLGAALASIGASAVDANAAIASLGGLFDFRKLRPGHKLKARMDDGGKLLALGIIQSVADQVETRRSNDSWKAERIDIPVETVVTTVSGTVHSSLWESIASTGEEPALIAEFADVFAWEVDFFRDVRDGDSYRMLVEKRYAKGKLVSYGRVLAAEYVNAGDTHRAFYFVRDDKTTGYFADNGESCKKLLLKMPLQYGRMTSGFGSRHHPVLGYTRAHNGVDYGVPVGTPVWAVGDGRVVKAGYGNGFGNVVEISHANGWTSQYAHLSSIAVKVGQHVSQKMTIARSGNTGMSTGPHLHYGLKRNNGYVNPAAQKFDRAEPLKGAELAAFKREVERLSSELDRISVAAL